MTRTALLSSDLGIKGAGFNFICVLKEKGQRFIKSYIKIHGNGYMKQRQVGSREIAGLLNQNRYRFVETGCKNYLAPFVAHQQLTAAIQQSIQMIKGRFSLHSPAGF